MLLCLAAAAVTLAGVRSRLAAPLLLGAAVAVTGAGRELAPALTRLTGMLPGWAPIAVTGIALLAAGATEGVDLVEGIYMGLAGPNYETPAEVRMLRGLGGDAVGMSTVLECIAARWAGLEVCGVVSAVGRGAAEQAPADDLLGRRVIALPALPHGGLAERAVAAVTDVFTIPDTMDDITAAALPVTYQTGWFGLYHRAALAPGETVLVHAGAGGVGSAAIQLARARGARVIATAGGADKVARCLELGAERAIDYRSEDFVEATKAFTDGRGADVIYDSVGGDTFDGSRRCVAFEGRIVVVGFAGGRIAEAPTNHLLVKNYSVVGLHWGLYRTRRTDLVRACHEELVRLHQEGAIAPLIGEVRPLAEAAAALTDLAGRATVGKVVLVP
jgi:NADPH2:quinone reductase